MKQAGNDGRGKEPVTQEGEMTPNEASDMWYQSNRQKVNGVDSIMDLAEGPSLFAAMAYGVLNPASLTSDQRRRIARRSSEALTMTLYGITSMGSLMSAYSQEAGTLEKQALNLGWLLQELGEAALKLRGINENAEYARLLHAEKRAAAANEVTA